MDNPISPPPLCFFSFLFNLVKYHQDFERRPKVAMNIARKWLAGSIPRDLPKWCYLNEFFTVQGLARRLTNPKFQSC